MSDILGLITNPDQFIALGNLLEVFTNLIRGDFTALSTADTSSALTDGDGWAALSTVAGGLLGS